MNSAVECIYLAVYRTLDANVQKYIARYRYLDGMAWEMTVIEHSTV